MNVIAPSGAKVYNISAGKTLPEWISQKKKSNLKRDPEFQRRIEILQDFEFKGACHKIKVSKDGQFVAATGVYPPQLKMFEVEQLSLKFERHIDCEVVQFQFLSDDYKKLVLLEADRTIEFHAQWGSYYKTRIPSFGRDLLFDETSADLFIAASTNEIYRLNLVIGRFLEPLITSSALGVNCIDQNKDHLLLVTGGANGIVDCFDTRQSRKVADLSFKFNQSKNSTSAITSLQFDPSDHLKMAVGNEDGIVSIFDIRSANPLLVKDHQYDEPIIKVQFNGDFVISTDRKICKIWNKMDGGAIANIEMGDAINEACIVPNSGLLFLSGEKEKVESYYIPILGPAPFWCSFLDNLTEELEESENQVIYDDYKFVTKNEIEQLGLGKMIGTPYLRAYMHGFFMDLRLYRKVKDFANPFGYKDYIKERIKEKREELQSSRITKKKKTPKVNRKMAERYLMDLKKSKDESNNDNNNNKNNNKNNNNDNNNKKSGGEIDDRFKAIFEKKDFEIDERSDEFKKVKNLEEDGEDNGGKFNARSKNGKTSVEDLRKKNKQISDVVKNMNLPGKTPPSKKEEAKKAANNEIERRKEELKKPLSERLLADEPKEKNKQNLEIRSVGGGNKELVFTPNSSSFSNRRKFDTDFNQNYKKKYDNNNNNNDNKGNNDAREEKRRKLTFSSGKTQKKAPRRIFKK